MEELSLQHCGLLLKTLIKLNLEEKFILSEIYTMLNALLYQEYLEYSLMFKLEINHNQPIL